MPVGMATSTKCYGDVVLLLFNVVALRRRRCGAKRARERSDSSQMLLLRLSFCFVVFAEHLLPIEVDLTVLSSCQ
jgi:hypothetical protein